MIQMTIGSNTKREKVLVDENDKVQNILQAHGINYDRAQVHLNGTPISAGDFSKSLGSLGAEDGTILIAVTKTDNA